MIVFDDVTKENTKKNIIKLVFIKILKNTIQTRNVKY